MAEVGDGNEITLAEAKYFNETTDIPLVRDGDKGKTYTTTNE